MQIKFIEYWADVPAGYEELSNHSPCLEFI